MTTTIKKAFTAVVAMVMALVLTVPAGAAYAAGTGSITITPPADTASDTMNTYKIYKVFDANGNGANNISYKLCNGDTLSADMKAAGFSVDSAGNVSGPDTLDQTAIAAIASYVTNDDLVATVTSTGTAAAVAKDLANGYYYITTSTGTAVTINSTNPNATVKDKNTVPSVDKKITDASSLDADGKKAFAQLGSTVSYESDINVPANSKKLVFNDTMGSGLTLNPASIAVKVRGTDVDTANYTKTVNGNTIKIVFADSYISKLSNATIVVTYTATVNSDALTVDTGKNTASLNYGDNKATTSSETQVYNAKITVTKNFQGLEEGASLNNDSAQFVLKNADGKYYKKDGTTVTWVDSEADATTLRFSKSGDKGNFTGLANGAYTLVESKTPAGYKTAENTTITINGGDYSTTNLSKSANITNETGSALPSTGGMGTTVLYAVGAALVITAGALLIARKRNTQE